jgi:hypothetical protein
MISDETPGVIQFDVQRKHGMMKVKPPNPKEEKC